MMSMPDMVDKELDILTTFTEVHRYPPPHSFRHKGMFPLIARVLPEN